MECLRNSILRIEGENNTIFITRTQKSERYGKCAYLPKIHVKKITFRNFSQVEFFVKQLKNEAFQPRFAGFAPVSPFSRRICWKNAFKVPRHSSASTPPVT